VAGQSGSQYVFQCAAANAVAGVQFFAVTQLCSSSPALTVTIASGAGSSADSLALQNALSNLIDLAKATYPSAGGLSNSPTASPISGSSPVVTLTETGKTQTNVRMLWACMHMHEPCIMLSCAHVRAHCDQ
jgi:hypothetical protein